MANTQVGQLALDSLGALLLDGVSGMANLSPQPLSSVCKFTARSWGMVACSAWKGSAVEV